MIALTDHMLEKIGLGRLHLTKALAASSYRSAGADELALFDIGQLLTQPRRRSRARIRRLCQTARLDDCVLCRVLGRYKMFVDAGDNSLAPHLMLDGLWEMPVTEAVLRSVSQGMTVVDVGANYGYYTMILAELVGPGGRVFAAEPNPRMMSLLDRSVAVNGFADRVTPVAQPLWAHASETVVLHVPVDRPQNASLAWSGDDRSEAFSLSTTTLDAMIGDGPVDFIKIDVEGAVESVWAGMRNILARKAPLTVFLEFTPDRYADPEAFLRRIVEHGMALGILHAKGGARSASIAEVMDGAPDLDRMLVITR